MDGNNGLGLEYGVSFNVEKGAEKATKEIKALANEWQAILDKQQLSIKMGADAAQYTKQANSSTGSTNQSALEKTNTALSAMAAHYKEVEETQKRFYAVNQSNKNAALDGLSTRLAQIKKEILDIEKELSGITIKSKPRHETTILTGWLTDLKKEAKQIESAMSGVQGEISGIHPYMANLAREATDVKLRMDALNDVKLNGANADKLNDELIKSNFELLQMKEQYKQINAENTRLVNNALSKTNTKDVFGMKESSIDEVEKKIQKLTRSSEILDSTMNAVGFNDAKLNGAARTASLELDRLQQKLVTLKSSFGNKSLDDLLNVNPKSIREANALMAELSNRRQDLNRGDVNYATNITSINKKQAELSAQNAKDLQLGIEKTKIINEQTKAYDTQSNTISQLRNMAMQYLSIYEGVRLVKSIAEITGQFELQRVSLSAIIRDADAANKIFSQEKSLAVLSPFKFMDLLSYTKQLAAYRIQTDELYDTTKRLADVSAGLGVDMNRIILAYGQISAASVLRGQEVRQMTEAGIPVIALLSEAFSKLENRAVSTNEVFDKISNRLVPFKMIKDMFTDMSSEGGMFYNMQEVQSETLAGKIANLTDAYQIMFASMGGDGIMNDILKGGVDTLMNIARNWKDIAAVISPVISALAIYKGSMLVISGMQKAELAYYSISQGLVNTKIANTEREIALETAKIGVQNAGLIYAKAQAASDALTTFMSGKKVQLTSAEIASLTIKNLVMKAGNDAQKLGILQSQIANVLQEQGLSKTMAAAAAQKIYTASVQTSTVATKGLMATLMASNPVGWVFAIISAFVAAGIAISHFVDKAYALERELKKIGSAGALDEKNMVSKFKALADTATDANKTFNEQETALKTLKNVYGDMLPAYSLTREYLSKLNGDYLNLTDTIRGYIEAKTKEKQIEAVQTNYEENVNPTYSKVIDGLKKAGISAGDAKQAMAEFQRQIEAGNTAGMNSNQIFAKLQSIVYDITNQKIDNKKVGWFAYDTTITNAEKLNDLLIDQKKDIEDIQNQASNVEMWGNLTKGNNELKKSIEEAVKNVKQGVKDVKGVATPFDESLYQFNERKAQVEQDLLIAHIEKLTNKSYEALRKGIENNTLRFPDLGVAKYMQNLFGQIDNLNVSPVQNKIHELITKMASTQGVSASQYGSYELPSGTDQAEHFKTLQDAYKDIKLKIEETNRATKDWTSNIKVASGVSETGFRSITKGELLNGYETVENGVKKTNAGLKDQFETIKLILDAFGILGEKQKKPRTSVKDPNIQILEDEMKAIEQAKKKYEELQKAGYSSAEAMAMVKKLYAGQISTKWGLQLAFDSTTLIADYNKYVKGLSKMKGTEKLRFEAGLKINDVQVDDVVKSLKAKLKDIEDKFNTDKRRIDLFKNIFDVTTDYDLAGRIAASFEGNGTTSIEVAMKKALKTAFETAKINLNDFVDSKGNVDFNKAGSTIDELLKVKNQEGNIALLSAQKQLNISKEFKQKEIIELFKGLEQYKTYEDKRVDILKQGMAERDVINGMTDISPEQKSVKINQSIKKQDENITKNTLSQFKESDAWATVFGDLDKVSAPVLQRLKAQLIEFRDASKGKLPINEFKELTKTIQDLEDKTTFIGLGEFIKAFKTDQQLPKLIEELRIANELKDKLKSQNTSDVSAQHDAQRTYDDIAKNPVSTTAPIQEQINYSMKLTTAKNAVNAANVKVEKSTIAYTDAVKAAAAADSKLTTAQNARVVAMSKAIKTNSETIAGYTKLKATVDDTVSAFYSIADAMGIAISPETKAILDGLTKGIGAVIAVLTAVGAVLEFVAWTATTAGAAIWAAMLPVLAILAPLIAIVALFAVFSAIRLGKINKEIEEQKAIVKQLEEQYQDLERAMKSALGTDWVRDYNAELVNLAAQAVALQKQVDLEKSKGKKTDKDKLEELNQSIRDNYAAQQEMATKLQQFVVGTDLTSAAKDFASAWLDAYKSFGSTTDAMKAKFKDMLNSMIVNTMLARVMQVALKPVFDLIEADSKDGSDGNAAYTPSEIAAIVAQTTKSMTDIDATSNAIMDGLKNAGIDLRDTTSNLTGVSKGISGVTEDTALLLGGYLDSIRFRLFAYLDLMSMTPAFDIAGSMASLMVAQNAQVTHLAAISANTLRSADASENLSKKIDSIIVLSNTGTGYAIRANV